MSATVTQAIRTHWFGPRRSRGLEGASTLAFLAALLVGLAVMMTSCSPPKGACVTSFGCSPDTTAAACALIFGDNITFYEETTCSDLGYNG